MKRRNWLMFASIAIPLAALAPWVLTHQGFPRSDAGPYMEVAYKIYRALISSGWDTFFSSLYTLREVKPTILPSLAAIGLVFTGGEILWLVRMLGALSFALFLAFAFLSLELFLPAAEAALTTVFFGLLPWCSFTAHYIGHEMPLLAVNTAALYWLIRCRTMEDKRAASWFGLCVGMSLLLRPMDALMLFFVPIVAWVTFALRSRRLRPLEPLFWLSTTLPTVWMLCHPQTSYFTMHFQLESVFSTLSLLSIPPAALFFFRRKLGMNEAFSRFFLLAYLSFALWYGPFYTMLFGWVFQATFGNHAQFVSHAIAGPRLWGRFFWWYGNIALLGAGLAAGLNLWRTKLPKEWSRWVFLLIGTAFFPLCMGFPTHDLSLRYYNASGILLLALALVIALYSSGKGTLRGLRVGIVLAIAGFSLVWDFGSVFFPRYLPKILPQDLQQEFYLPLSPWKHDLADDAIDALAAQIRSNEKQVILLSMQLPEEALYYFGNFESLELAAWERGYDWEFLRTQSQPSDFTVVPLLVDEKLEKMKLLVQAAYPQTQLVAEVPLSRPGYNGTVLVLRKLNP